MGLANKTCHHVGPISKCLHAGLLIWNEHCTLTAARACRKCRGLTVPRRGASTLVYCGARYTPDLEGPSSNVGLETTGDRQIISNTLLLLATGTWSLKLRNPIGEMLAPRLLSLTCEYMIWFCSSSALASSSPFVAASEQYQRLSRVCHVQRFRPSSSVLRGRDCHGEACTYADHLFRGLLDLTRTLREALSYSKGSTCG